MSKNLVKTDKLNKDTTGTFNSDTWITVFTDASYCPDTKAWGVGVWIKSKEGTKQFSRNGSDFFNGIHKVELHAIHEALNFIYANIDSADKRLLIQSDSTSALNKLDLASVYKVLQVKKVTLKHVKAHTDNQTKRTYVNALVDSLAYAAMNTARTKVKLSALRA